MRPKKKTTTGFMTPISPLKEWENQMRFRMWPWQLEVAQEKHIFMVTNPIISFVQHFSFFKQIYWDIYHRTYPFKGYNSCLLLWQNCISITTNFTYFYYPKLPTLASHPPIPTLLKSRQLIVYFLSLNLCLFWT